MESLGTPRWPLWMPLALLALTLAAYANSFRGAFVFDDQIKIVENPSIRQLWPLPPGLVSRRGLVELSLAINYALSGYQTWSYHLFNLSVHLLAGMTLFGLARRLWLSHSRLCPPAKTGPGSSTVGSPSLFAFAMALLFLLHPLQTQAVTYIIQRSEAMMGLFFLLSLYALARSHSRPTAPWLWWGLAWIPCILALASKEVAVSLPLVALLMDRACLAGSFRVALRRRWPLYAGFALIYVLGFLLAWHMGLLADLFDPEASAGFAVKRVSPWRYALAQPAVILHYLRLSFWPAGQCLDYLWSLDRPTVETWLSIAALSCLLLATLWALFRKPVAGFLGAAFFLILAPTSSFIPLYDPAMEHRMYLPLAIVVALAVLAASKLMEQVRRRGSPWSGITPRLAGAALVCAALGLGSATFQRNHDYRSPIALWTDTVKKCPHNGRAFQALAGAWSEAGDLRQAVLALQRSLELYPPNPQGWVSLGRMQMDLKEPGPAVGSFQKALQYAPSTTNRIHLAQALAQHGQAQEAEQLFLAALQDQPPLAAAWLALGQRRLEQGEYRQAIRLLLEAARLSNQPQQRYPIHLALGKAYLLDAQIQNAAAAWREALALASPQQADAHSRLGALYLNQNRFDLALPLLKEAAARDAGHAGAHNLYGQALARLGRLPLAVEQFREATRLAPEDPEGWSNLGNALLEQNLYEPAIAAHRTALACPSPLPEHQRRLALTLATYPAATPAQVAEAVELARQANHATGGNHRAFLQTLAAAYRKAGQWEMAQQIEQKAPPADAASRPAADMMGGPLP